MIDPTVSDLPRQQLLNKTAQAANPTAMMTTIQFMQRCQLSSEPKAVVQSSQPCVLMPQSTQSVKDPSTPSSGSSTQILRTFERYFNIDPKNKSKQCLSLRVLDRDAPLINDLLMTWTLDSGLCFFDLLGFDIYDHWKKLGASQEDLQRYCTYCKKLSVELLKTTNNPINENVFKTIRLVFQSLDQKIPIELKPKFELLLKALSHPAQAAVLGCAPVQKFGKNEVLDGTHSRREDVVAFLDFAKQMYPTDFSFINPTCDYVTISRKLNSLMELIVNQSEITDAMTDQYNFATTLKIISDKRLSKIEININRLFVNMQLMDFSSKYLPWIQEKLQEYLGKDFQVGGGEDIQHLIDQYGLLIPPDTLYIGMNIVTNKCTIQGCNLEALEVEIAERLKLERQSNTLEEYAQIFTEMIRLYQIIHDIYTLKDVVNYRLNGKEIPNSFFEESDLRTKEFLVDKAAKPKVVSPMSVLLQTPSTEPKQSPASNVPVSAPLAKELPVCVTVPSVVPQLSPKSVVPVSAPAQAPKKESSPIRTVEETSPREEKRPREEKHAQPSTEVEKPYFPPKNASGSEVLSHLLNNDFVNMRTKGGHYQMEHVSTKVHTTVPIHPSKPIASGTLASIRRAFYRSKGFER